MKSTRTFYTLIGITSLLILILVVSGGCTGGSGGSGAAKLSQPGADGPAVVDTGATPSATPAFIEELDIAPPLELNHASDGTKRASYDDPTGRFCYGEGFEYGSNAEKGLGLAWLEPGGDWAWVAYQFIYDPNTAVITDINFESYSPVSIYDVWVGLANWDEDRWDWFEASDNGYMPFYSPLVFTPYQRPLSSNCETLAILMVGGDEDMVIQWSRLGGSVQPVAVLEVDYSMTWKISDGPPPTYTVCFDYSESETFDNDMAFVDWDWDNDGWWDETCFFTGTKYHDYEGTGTFTATMRIDGNFLLPPYNEASVTFELPPEWP